MLGSACWVVGGASAASLAATTTTTTTVSVTQGSLKLTPSANPRAGSPLAITASGVAGVTSTLQVFVQFGQPCAASQEQEVVISAPHIDQRVITGSAAPFSATSEFTPATPGTYFVCGYLDGAAAGTQTSQTASIAMTVGPTACVVPGLFGHSLAGARHALAAAGCALGVILRPSAAGLSRTRSRPGGQALVLLVGSQFPAAGTALRPNQYVAVRLVLRRRPGSRGHSGIR